MCGAAYGTRLGWIRCGGSRANGPSDLIGDKTKNQIVKADCRRRPSEFLVEAVHRRLYQRRHPITGCFGAMLDGKRFGVPAHQHGAVLYDVLCVVEHLIRVTQKFAEVGKRR